MHHSAGADLSHAWIIFSPCILGDLNVQSFCLPSPSCSQEKGTFCLLPKRAIQPRNAAGKNKAYIHNPSSKTEHAVTYANKGQA